MDYPRFIADWISKMSGKKAEAEPSEADIRGDRFVVSIESFFTEAQGETPFQELERQSFVENGGTTQSYIMALPIRVAWVSQGSGEQWRGLFLKQAQHNVKMFASPFHIPGSGGKIVGEAADKCNDGVPQDIANFDEVNTDDIHGLGFPVFLTRAPDLDVVFEKIEGEKRGYLAQQVFTGHVGFHDGITTTEV